MKASRFFRYLWRLNGILILLAALFGVIILGYFLFEIIGFESNPNRQAVEVTAEPEEEAEPPALGSLSPIDGSPYLRAPLTFGDRHCYRKFGGSGGAYSTRNYLFFNTETAESRWLFSDDTRLILGSNELRKEIKTEEPGSSKRVTVAFSYMIVGRDTDGDNQLTGDDAGTLAYSRPDGSGYTPVIEGIDKILGKQTIDNAAREVVVYEAENRWLTAVIALDSFEIEKI